MKKYYFIFHLNIHNIKSLDLIYKRKKNNIIHKDNSNNNINFDNTNDVNNKSLSISDKDLNNSNDEEIDDISNIDLSDKINDDIDMHYDSNRNKNYENLFMEYKHLTIALN